MNRQQRRAAAKAGIKPAPLRPMAYNAVSLMDVESEESAEALFKYAIERHQVKEVLDEVVKKIQDDAVKRAKKFLADLVLSEIYASEDLCGCVYFTAFVMAANKVYNFTEENKKIIDEIPEFVQMVEKDPKYWFTKINQEYGLGLQTDIFDGDETFLERVKRYVEERRQLEEEVMAIEESKLP